MNQVKYPQGCKDIQVELANDELIRRLKKIQQSFQNLDQSSTEKYKELSICLGSELFLQHEHEDVQLLVACCLADIFRINAPDSPFQDPLNLKNIFIFLANQLRGLKENANTSFKRYFYLLENLECVKTFQLCLDLEESSEIIAVLFENVFKIINEKSTAKVKSLLFELLHPLINESEQISARVFDCLFRHIIEPMKSNNKEAYNLAVLLLKKGNEHFEYLVQNHLNNILLTNRATRLNNSGNGSSLNADASFSEEFTSNASSQFISDKLCLIIYELNTIRYSLLELVMPQLEYKLKSSDLKERREYTKLLSKMFSEKDSQLAKKLPQLWDAYLERFADMNEDIRKICVQHISDFLIQQTASQTSSSGAGEASNEQTVSVQSNHILEQIVEQIKSRGLDSDEAIRFEVVQEILKAIKVDSNIIGADLLNILKERTLDVKIRVRKAALQGLAALYKKIHSKTSFSRLTVQMINWVPTKIMRMYFQDSAEDKLVVERLLNSSIVPYTLSAREKMAQLYYAFTTLDEYSMMALIEIMKNRVLLYQLMKTIIDSTETKTPTELTYDMQMISNYLLDVQKGNEFLKTLVSTLKTNVNLRNYFKQFININCTCQKTMQLIQLIFTNLSNLNQTQMSMARRLIERMSSLIIDKECFESLIELVEYKIKQKLTPKQRRMLMKQKKKTQASKASGKASKKKTSGRSKKNENWSSDEEDENDEDNDDEFDDDDEDDNDDDENQDDFESNDEEEEPDDTQGDEDDDGSSEKQASSSREDYLLVKHIDDDGEKGLKLISVILMIHNNYGFNNSATYQKLFSFLNSRKDNVLTSTLKLLSTYYSPVIRSNTKDDLFHTVNSQYLDKLKHFCKNGKPKHVKHAIHLIYNNFEQPKNEQILHDLFKELSEELKLKQNKTFINCLVGLGYISYLIPQLVGGESKEFIAKNIAKEILMVPSNTILNITNSSDKSATSLSLKRKNNLKLAGKWCENEEELPLNTRIRIQAVKLVVRWCLGLKGECTSILSTFKILAKMIKDNAPDQSNENVCEAELSRVRAVCVAQMIKLAQEPAFKPLINSEYFHVIAKLVVDPVNNVRDVVIKKLHKGLKNSKLSIYFMAIFALCGFDSNKERKSRVKKLYSILVKSIRASDAKEQQKPQPEGARKKSRILPEMCLPHAVSLLAHNIKIDSLKDDVKVKQIKECMAIILDPLLENPDSYQIAYIKKMLNTIKISDDGLAAATVTSLSKQMQTADTSSIAELNAKNKVALQNLYYLNKNLCIICEIFLFHMHSKAFNYIVAKDVNIEVKLPSGFFSVRENFNSEEQEKFEKELKEQMKVSSLKEKEVARSDDSANNSEQVEMDDASAISSRKNEQLISKIEITRKKRKASFENDEIDEEENDENEAKESSVLVDSSRTRRTNTSKASSNNSSTFSNSSTPRTKRNRLSAPKVKSNESDELKEEPAKRGGKAKTESKKTSSRSSTRGKNKKQEEDEKENENEDDEDDEKQDDEEVDQEEEEEEDEQESESKKVSMARGTRRQSTAKKSTTEPENSKKLATVGKKDSLSPNSSSYSLRQKRATVSKK